MIEVLFLFFIFSINKFAIFAEVLVFAPIHNENEKQKSIVSLNMYQKSSFTSLFLLLYKRNVTLLYHTVAKLLDHNNRELKQRRRQQERQKSGLY